LGELLLLAGGSCGGRLVGIAVLPIAPRPLSSPSAFCTSYGSTPAVPPSSPLPLVSGAQGTPNAPSRYRCRFSGHRGAEITRRLCR